MPPYRLPFLSGLSVLCGALLVPATASAGAWTREPGGVYARAGLSALLPSDGYFDADRDRQTLLGASYKEIAATLDAEIGVIDRLTALAHFAFWNVDLGAERQDGRGGTSFGIPGQAGIGARVRLLDAPLLLALQAEGRFALIRDQDPEPHRWGDGRDEARLVGVGSRSFGPVWVSLELGGKLRGELPANQLVYLAQAGRWFGPVALEVDLDGAESLADPPSDSTLGGQYADVTNPLVDTVAADAAHRFGLKAIVRAAPWLEIDGGFQMTYLGRSAANAPRLNLGAAFVF